MLYTDPREDAHMFESDAWLSLSVIDAGNVSKVRRPGYTGTTLDITLASESIATKISGLEISEEYMAVITSTQYLASMKK